MTTKPRRLRLEALEQRDTPASFFSYTDGDGDQVKLALSAGDLGVTTTPIGLGLQVNRITVTGAADGADLTMTVRRAPGGDGRADIDNIQSSMDLGNVRILGDLGGIQAGDGDDSAPAIRSLRVHSFAAKRDGSSTTFEGDVGRLTVTANLKRQLVIGGDLGPVSIGGSIITGALFVTGNIGPIKIGGDLEGTMFGSTGYIRASGDIASVTIGGSVRGGDNSDSGRIHAIGDLGPVRIGGDLIGGSVNTASIRYTDTGSIFGRQIASVHIGGSLVAGLADPIGSSLLRSGAITAQEDIGPITVRRNVVGHPTNPVMIFARGQADPMPKGDIAIKSVTVGGRVEHTWIWGGCDTNGGVIGGNGNAQIGAVKVGGDWIASQLQAGCTSVDGNLGDANDAAIAGGTRSRIASVNIRGQVFGSSGNTYGFFAREIGSFKVAGASLPLVKGAGNDTFALGRAIAVGSSTSSITPDNFAVHVFEVP